MKKKQATSATKTTKKTKTKKTPSQKKSTSTKAKQDTEQTQGTSKKNKPAQQPSSQQEKKGQKKTRSASVKLYSESIQSAHIQNLAQLHDEKLDMLTQISSEEEFSEKPLEISQRQVNVVETDMGFFDVDWDKVVYTTRGKEIVLKEVLNLDQRPSELNHEELRIVENILSHIKMFFLLLKEDWKVFENHDHDTAKKNLRQQEDELREVINLLGKKDLLEQEEEIDRYEFKSKDIPIIIRILKKYGDFVPIYELNISEISKHTEFFLEKIRKELIHEVNLGIVDITDVKRKGVVEEKFSTTISNLVHRYFPDIDDEKMGFLKTYLIQKALGLGKVDLLMDDPFLEEIAINCADEPIWVYHKKHEWLKTRVWLESEEQIRHYATMIGRKVGRQISVLEPLLDASLGRGDRVNATLMPISAMGNTITIRKSASKPWTITDFIRSRTITAEAVAMIWLGLQYELSMLIAGGTASGKTSMLNGLASLLPPNQRILSIEDTRELKLPKFLHWVPMTTKLPNAEGKGGIAMIDLLVNALRQRPDRILVGEIRRKREAETMFEAMHTGHSVYATVHANTTQDAITRLTNKPIEIPKTMLPAISMIVVQYRNRRSGKRRTFQVSEINENGDGNIIYQYDAQTDQQVLANKSSTIMQTINLFTGMSEKEIQGMLDGMVSILNWMVRKEINDIDSIGRVIAEYYTNKEYLMDIVKKDKDFA